MDKIKGWKAEQRIDDYLHHDKVRSSMCESARLLIQAKTLIMTLREENKFLEKECKRESDDYVEYHNKWLDADCELRKLKKQNKEMLKQHQDYFVENENLKQELADCIMSNELLDKENDRLRQSETEAKEIIAELESKLAEYEKFGLNKDLENLKRLK